MQKKPVTMFVQMKKRELHYELQKMTDYVEWVRDKNLNCEYEVIKTIGVVF